MKNGITVKALLFGLMLLSAGCGREDENAVPRISGTESPGINREPASVHSGFPGVGTEPANVNPESSGVGSGSASVNSGFPEVSPTASELLDAFLAGETSASYGEGSGTLAVSDLTFDGEDYFSYSVGERVDLDNDGEDEQILDGPYGGIYLDAREGEVHVLAQGEGTAGILFYTHFEDAVWVVHCDTTHGGRQVYWLEKHDGGGNVVDEFQLSAEYWDSPDDKYDEDSDFSYRDEKITMTEFEALREQILGGKDKE